ncbi:hypothetical protein LINPERPRIM_LOCUS18597 [Linum perenne]
MRVGPYLTLTVLVIHTRALRLLGGLSEMVKESLYRRWEIVRSLEPNWVLSYRV